ECRSLVSDRRGADGAGELSAEAHRLFVVRFRVHRRPSHPVHVEARAVRVSLLVEEVFERAVEEVEEARVVHDLRVIFVSEAHADPAHERHRARVWPIYAALAFDASRSAILLASMSVTWCRN